MLTWLLAAAAAAVPDPGLIATVRPHVEACAGAPLGDVTVALADLPVGTRSTAERDATRLVVRLDDELDEAVHPYELVLALARGAGQDLPPLIREGRAELVARCVAARGVDVPLPSFADLDLTRLAVDLTAWDGTGPPVYASSARSLFALLERVLAREALLAPEVRTWADVDALLASGTPPAATVHAALTPGRSGQIELLANPDGDALPTGVEALTGTDPARWDSDGDGWWDGAPAQRPAEAVPWIAHLQRRCLPWMPEDGRALRVGLHTVDGDGISRTRDGDLAWTAEDAEAHELPQILVLPGGFSSRTWVTPPADVAVVPHPSCASSTGVTVRSTVAELDPAVAPLLDAILALLGETEQRTGRPLGSLEVHLGGPRMAVIANRHVIVAGTDAVERAQRRGPEDLARVVVAAHALADTGHPRLLEGGALESFRHWLFPDVRPKSWWDVFPSDTRDWDRRASRCAEGWPDLLGGRCR